MKTLQFVVLVVFIVSATCLENLDEFSSNLKQDFSLNQGEFIPQEDFNENLREYDNQFGYKLKTKKYIPPESNQRVQYTIIKRTHEIPYSKNYGGGVGHSSAEQLSYHNKHPSKYSYSVAHKPKVMPVRVVQEGSVKHIYLDMPDVFDETLPKTKPLQIPNSYDNIKQAGSFNNQQFNSFAPVKYEQNYQAPVQYSYPQQNVNAVPGFPQAGNEHGFNTLSSGYRVGKSNDVNALVQNLEHQFSNGLGSHAQGQQPQYIPQSFGNSDFSSGISQYGSFKNEYANANPAQFTPQGNTEFSHPQFPQYSADGTEKYTYEIPEQYKSLFANNPYGSAQFGQSEEFKPSVGYQQHDFGKTARMSSVSGFNPDLVNIVNDVLHKGQGYSTPDGFKMIKSNDEKSVYLIGKPGMPLDAVPNLASYSFAANSKGVENPQPDNVQFH